jgi:hypothetical protein
VTPLVGGPASRRRGRRGGYSYTVIVMCLSALILVSASLFTQASTHTLQYSALHSRHSKLREAAFGGVRWAARDAKLEGQGAGHAVLRLDGHVTVEVDYRRAVGESGSALSVTSVARMLDLVVTVRATCPEVEGDYRLGDFEVENGGAKAP